MSTQSKACCTVPPVVTEGYKEKGEWITINGMKTYATGPKDAKSACGGLLLSAPDYTFGTNGVGMPGCNVFPCFPLGCVSIGAYSD